MGPVECGRGRQSVRRGSQASAAAVVASLVLASGVAAQASDERLRLLPGAGGVHFVDEAGCRSCHASQTDAWRGSHHDLAMAAATAETVLGDFDDASFDDRGLTTRFFRRDGDFFVHTEGPDGTLRDYRVAYVFGFDPLQQVLVEFPGGRLQTLTIAWDVNARRWFTLYPEERFAAGDALHWTGRYQTWNFMCAECHSTDLRKGYDPAADRYTTTWARIDVGCQACHGPGAAHLAWAETAKLGGKDSGGVAPAGPGAASASTENPTHGASAPNAASPATAADARPAGSERGAHGLVVELGALSSAQQVDACARCHARRHRVSPEDAHGRPFLDDFAPELLREGLYDADGQIAEEVYVYGSFLQSKMYGAGVACGDCHDPHSLSLKQPGDAVCLQCHSPSPPTTRFSSLRAARYDSPDHHFHPAESEGARCVGCHMPSKVYMQVDARRDHGLRIPRPDLSQQLGVRNACTDCHADRSAGWAAAALDERKGLGWRRKGGFAAALHDGRRGAAGAERALRAVVVDEGQSAIVRASALEQLRVYGPVSGDAVVRAARSDEPLLRAAAAGGLDLVSPEARGRVAGPLLRDPIRAVRAEAARSLASTSAELSPADRAALTSAMAEVEAAAWTDADSPGGRTHLAVLAAAQGRMDEAQAHYLAALALDAAFFPASLNLAASYNGTGRNPEAEQVLRAAIAHSPDEGELYYSLGLLLAEQQRLAEAEKALGAAAARIPDRARVRYNHALALQHLGRTSEAERELLEALRIERDDPAISHALVILYLQQQRYDEALPHAERLAAMVPEARGLLQQIQMQRSLRDAP